MKTKGEGVRVGGAGWVSVYVRVGMVVCMSRKFNVGTCRSDVCFTKKFEDSERRRWSFLLGKIVCLGTGMKRLEYVLRQSVVELLVKNLVFWDFENHSLDFRIALVEFYSKQQ